MEFKDFKEIFSDVLPIIYRASPIIGSLIGSPATNIIVGLLALLSNTNACDHHHVACQLKHDEDLYSKLVQLEKTHAEWLKQIKDK